MPRGGDGRPSAFSGGGIRSATFGLGTVRGLARLGLLSKFDCLSTVSCGGYLGSFAILARNLRNSLDVAFSRRLKVIVEFPLPSVADRERIWRRLVTQRVPQAPDVDLAYLAKHFGLAGGNLKNCAVAAALAAAAEGGPVEMWHLMQAIARKYEKIGKSVAPALFEPYGGVVG